METDAVYFGWFAKGAQLLGLVTGVRVAAALGCAGGTPCICQALLPPAWGSRTLFFNNHFKGLTCSFGMARDWQGCSKRKCETHVNLLFSIWFCFFTFVSHHVACPYRSLMLFPETFMPWLCRPWLCPLGTLNSQKKHFCKTFSWSRGSFWVFIQCLARCHGIIKWFGLEGNL